MAYHTRCSQSMRTPIRRSEASYQTFTYIGSLAGIRYLVKFQLMYLIFALKTTLSYTIQSNNLHQIRLNI